MRDAERISQALFSGDLEALTEAQLDQACRTMPTTPLVKGELDRLGVLGLLTRVGLAGSKREARDLVSAGAISVNGRRVGGIDAVLNADTLRFGRFVIIRKGKKSYHVATLA
jgi:tyrosyl-tRNA synthetase